MKTKRAADASELIDIPNVGSAMVRVLMSLGIEKSADLSGMDARELYQQLCHRAGVRWGAHVLDTHIAAIGFMGGAPARPWRYFFNERKRSCPEA